MVVSLEGSAAIVQIAPVREVHDVFSLELLGPFPEEIRDLLSNKMLDDSSWHESGDHLTNLLPSCNGAGQQYPIFTRKVIDLRRLFLGLTDDKYYVKYVDKCVNGQHRLKMVIGFGKPGPETRGLVDARTAREILSYYARRYFRIKGVWLNLHISRESNEGYKAITIIVNAIPYVSKSAAEILAEISLRPILIVKDRIKFVLMK